MLTESKTIGGSVKILAKLISSNITDQPLHQLIDKSEEVGYLNCKEVVFRIVAIGLQLGVNEFCKQQGIDQLSGHMVT